MAYVSGNRQLGQSDGSIFHFRLQYPRRSNPISFISLCGYTRSCLAGHLGTLCSSFLRNFAFRFARIGRPGRWRASEGLKLPAAQVLDASLPAEAARLRSVAFLSAESIISSQTTPIPYLPPSGTFDTANSQPPPGLS